MDTIVRSKSKQVKIGPTQPTRIIGERINPTGRKLLAAALAEKDMSRVKKLAEAQVAEGAAILDINVGAVGVNEIEVLPLAVLAVMEVTDVPLCLDSANPLALRAALEVYQGKALINSVNGEEAKLAQVLPLVKEYGAAVIGLTMDDGGIPKTAEARLAVAAKIIARAEALGIPREDLLIDCLALTVSADSGAAVVTLEAIRLVREQLGVNQTLGTSNISFGLPDREAVNDVFLSMALAAGVYAPIFNPALACKTAAVADLLLGRDEYAVRYIRYCRAHPVAS